MSNSIEKKHVIYMQVLGERLRRIRLKKGFLFIKDLNISGMNALSYGYIERGQRDARFTTLIEICNYFGVSIDDLFLNLDDEVKLQLQKIENTEKITKTNHLEST